MKQVFAPITSKGPSAGKVYLSTTNRWLAFATVLLSCSALTNVATAQEATESSGEIVVTAKNLRALPGEDVSGVFGFDKTITETPRSVSTISSDQLERFGITDIYGLVAQSPGTFTNSFFGVGGALDIRGTPGETYFRGVRRLDNPGNYPTPIGASDRIDIVRGPASPIYGPSKTGGYINFVPKSSRSADGKFLDKPEGEISYTGGSWDKGVLSATVTGPGKIGDREFGYTLYGEVEDSGSYYRNIFTKQKIVQASFETDLTPNLRAEFGGMYQDFTGRQNGGWNRLTQDLVDNGTYITGSAQPVDANGDGQLSRDEFRAIGDFNPFGGFACGIFSPFAADMTDACYSGSYPWLALQPGTVGTTKLDRSNTLTGPTDKLNNKDLLVYFDLIWDVGGGWEIKNQFFYESYENLNENAYGFSQFHNSYVVEDKIVISKDFELPGVDIATQISPSVRYTKFKHGDDFNFEYFHRVDLSVGYNALSDRFLTTEGDRSLAGVPAYSEHYSGHYWDVGLAALADVTFDWGLGVLLGARYDSFDIESRGYGEDPFAVFGNADNKDNGLSWTASVNYEMPFGLIPYATASRQTTLVAGQGAEVTVGNVLTRKFLSASEMYEGGVKGSFFDNRLYAAVSFYEQERTDFSSQSIVTNQAVKTEGMEIEARWAPTEKWLITAAYTKTKVVNLTALSAGSLFSFYGIEDLINVSDPTLVLGGQPGGLVPILNENDARRAGIPEDLYSVTGTYKFDNGLSLSGDVSFVDAVYSGQSQAVKLPAYTLVNLGAAYETGNWLFRFNVKNVTDEDYYRANFTELFGSTIVLPEQPRSVQASVIYKFN